MENNTKFYGMFAKSVLKTKCYNDYKIRTVLRSNLEDIYCDKFIIINDELIIGKARADIVIVKDGLTGYEIKDYTDTYKSLQEQIKEYDIYFQKNYLVVGAVNIKTAATHIPPYWGIMCLTIAKYAKYGIYVLETVREAEQNPKFNLKKQLSLLWRNELTHILKMNKLLKCTDKTKTYIKNYLFRSVSQNTLQKQICKELLERDWFIYRVCKME